MLVEDKPHSADVLGDWRDGWWSADFLDLVAKRLALHELSAAVDVGSGHGHWGRLILPRLSPGATMTGVDRETEWVRAASAAVPPEFEGRLFYEHASAERLPFSDESVDLVTCQTLLMHVSDVAAVCAEMFRILEPGGMLLVSEPTNLANVLIRDSVTATYDPGRIARIAEFHAYVARGRDLLDEGDECVGDRLPSLLCRLGFRGVTVSQNERVQPVHPPYQPGMLEAMQPFPDLVRERRWLFDPAYARRLYDAAGGPPERFQQLHDEFVDQAETCLSEIEAASYCAILGNSHYLIGARKPD